MGAGWSAYKPMKFIAFIVKIVNKFYNSILSHHVGYIAGEYHLLTSLHSHSLYYLSGFLKISMSSLMLDSAKKDSNRFPRILFKQLPFYDHLQNLVCIFLFLLFVSFSVSLVGKQSITFNRYG